MKNKKIILCSVIGLVIIIIGAVCLFMLVKDHIPENSYLNTFDVEITDENSLEYSYKKNVIIEIVDVQQDDDNTIAAVKVILPDIYKIYQEIIVKYDLDSTVSENPAILRDLKSNMAKYTITRNVESAVTKDKGIWVIDDKEKIDKLINEQLGDFLLNAFSHVEFTPFDVGGMMVCKRIISIATVVILIFSSIVITNAEVTPPSPKATEQYDMESYDSDLWNKYGLLFSSTPYRFLTEKSLFAYQGFVEDLNTSGASKWAIEAAAGVTGESATVERNIEILVNLITLMEYDLNDVNNHQVEADTFKTFGDYAKDVAGLVLDSASLSGITGHLKKVVKAANLTFSAVDDIVITSIDSYKLLNKMLLNYETYYNFLDTIIKYADDANLVEAAKVLRNNINRAMEYKLNHFNETMGNTAKFLGKDVFLDTVVIETLKNPDNLALNSVDEFCINTLSNAYQKVNDIWSGINLSKDLGVFAADMLVGISDMMNRCIETKIMYTINNALIKNIEELRKDLHSIEDLDNIDRIYNSMRYMMYVNGRGDFCLYQLIQKDAKLLSLIFNDRENTEKWWSKIQGVFELLAIDLDLFYPDIKNYLINTGLTDTQTGTNTVTGIIALSEKEKSFVKQLSVEMSYSKFSFDSSTASSTDIAKLMYTNIIAGSCWAYEYFWGDKGEYVAPNLTLEPLRFYTCDGEN